jgi:hypothetical protein
MRNKPWPIVAGIAVLIAVAAAFLLTPSEPSYKGKPLTYWLQAYKIPFTATNGLWRNGKALGADDEAPSRFETDAAIKAIGTNAIPTLLRLIQHRDSRLRYWQFSLARKSPFFRIAPVSSFSPNYEAFMAFKVLGTNAGPAVPQLLEIYNRESDRDTRDRVVSALTQIGPPAQPAVPMLLRRLAGTNTWMRVNAIVALGAIHSDSEAVVPALTSSLRDPGYDVRFAAIMALKDFGKAAKSAGPALVELLSDAKRDTWPSPAFATWTGGRAQIPSLGAIATNALLEIDPAAAAKAGIRDDW